MAVNIPWWAKIGAKLVLSRLPFNYHLWQKLGLFRHGNMDQCAYLSKVFANHVSRAGLKADLVGKTVLELGPGDSVGTALVAASHGAKAILLDAGSFAVKDAGFYRSLANELSAIGLNPPDISNASTLDDVLEACNARYLTNGFADFSFIKTGSVDLVYSQAVLEHVHKNEFFETMCECHRVLSQKGVASHRVDLKDHLNGGLNSLRFSRNIWESDIFVKSGFYTNRIRFSEMFALFKRAGFDVELLKVDRWDKLPIKRRRLNEEFIELSDDELKVKGFDVLLKPLSSA